MTTRVQDFTADHFALLGFSRKQSLDGDALEKSFRAMQLEIHPDRHATGSDADQRLAMQWSTQANAAVQTLKSPLRRAIYLLQLLGHDPEVETNTAMPTEFLMNQIELREHIEEARSSGSEADLDDVRSNLLAEIKAEHTVLSRLLDEDKDYPAATSLVRQLMFQEKLLTEIDDALEVVTG